MQVTKKAIFAALWQSPIHKSKTQDEHIMSIGIRIARCQLPCINAIASLSKSQEPTQRLIRANASSIGKVVWACGHLPIPKMDQGLGTVTGSDWPMRLILMARTSGPTAEVWLMHLNMLHPLGLMQLVQHTTCRPREEVRSTKTNAILSRERQGNIWLQHIMTGQAKQASSQHITHRFVVIRA